LLSLDGKFVGFCGRLLGVSTAAAISTVKEVGVRRE
jgi:hypothetical protein